MKARIRIETTVEVDRKDFGALESAEPVELMRTAEMQGAKVNTSVERTRKPVEKAKPEITEKQQPEETQKKEA